MAINTGFVNEKDFRKYLNKKRFCDLNENFQKFLKFITKQEEFSGEITCVKAQSGQKPDCIIIINEKRYPISLKCGSGNSVHQEKFEMFLNFLENIDFPQEAISLLKYYHYADGTDNDTGTMRLSSREYIHQNPEKIKKLNTFLNSEKFVKKILDRVLFIGKSDEYETAEFLYHGSLASGLWASRDELLTNLPVINESSVNVAFLTYQPWGRNQDFSAVHPDRRYVSQFKFGSCSETLKEIRKNND
ncbi:MAG: hypothetical protein E7013_02555 [Alphaproteobacteria bacterium]|nr:hypothetical protein [Alphaproteobacteria bacterium]